MATFKDIGAFAREVNKMDRRIAGDSAKEITLEQAKLGQRIAQRAASADLGGDPKFSGWAPELVTEIKPTRKNGHVLLPTRKSAGPWTVAEQGRNKGNASGFQGPGANRRTGMTSRTKAGKVRKVRAVKARRWNGYTAGKNTASDAVSIMEATLPPVAARGLTKAMRRHFDVS